MAIHFSDAENSQSCGQHEAKLAKNCANDSHIALPVKHVPPRYLRKDASVNNWVSSKHDQTYGYSVGRSCQKRDLVSLCVKVESCSAIEKPYDSNDKPRLPLICIDILLVARQKLLAHIRDTVLRWIRWRLLQKRRSRVMTAGFQIYVVLSWHFSVR